MPQTLIDISEDMQALDDLLFELGGDVSDEKAFTAVAAWMKELEDNLKGKADGYAALITIMEKRAQGRSEEAKRLLSRARIDTSAAEFLRGKLKAVMDKHNMKKLETERFRISIAVNGGKAPLTIYDDLLIPDKYLVPQLPALDREALRAAIEAGEDVPGAKLEARGTSLRIK